MARIAGGRCGLALAALGAAACAGVGACGGEGELDPRGARGGVLVGEVAATDARLAVVEQGEEARAYVCGGPATFATHSRWFALAVSQVEPGRRAVRGEAEGWLLTGELRGAEAEGELRGPGGVEARWHARAPVDELSGLYEGVDEGCRTGLIIDAKAGGEPAAQGTWCSRQRDLKAQVTPVRPLWLREGGLWAEARPGGEARRLWLSPVRPRRAP